MKFTLTITDASAADIARLMAQINGSVPAPTATPPAVVTTSHDDDESGDTEADTTTVDAEGIPWDDRIHSTPAKRTKNGIWRKKRGVQESMISQVEAELKAKLAATPVPPQPAPAPAPMATPPAPMPVPPQPVAAAPQPAPMPVPPQPAPAPAPMATPPAAAPQQPAPPAAGSVDFSAFMQHIQSKLPTGEMDAAYLNGVAQRIATAFNQPVNAITDIAANPQMIDYAVQLMQLDQKW